MHYKLKNNLIKVRRLLISMYGKSLASAFLGAFCPLPFRNSAYYMPWELIFAIFFRFLTYPQRFIPQKTENKSIPENTCELSKLS